MEAKPIIAECDQAWAFFNLCEQFNGIACEKEFTGYKVCIPWFFFEFDPYYLKMLGEI